MRRSRGRGPSCKYYHRRHYTSISCSQSVSQWRVASSQHYRLAGIGMTQTQQAQRRLYHMNTATVWKLRSSLVVSRPKFTKLCMHAREWPLLQRRYPSDVPEIFAIKLISWLKSCQNFDVLGPPKFYFRGGTPNVCRREFDKSGSPLRHTAVWWRWIERTRRLAKKKRKI